MHYDIIIIGGGLVGKSLAFALQKASFNLALIDASPKQHTDPRLIALNYGSISFLNSLGLFSSLEPFCTPIHEIEISHRGHFGGTRLNGKQSQLPALGYVIRAQQLNETLDQALLHSTSQNHFREWRPARVKALALHKQQATLSIEEQGRESQLTGSLIIGADGSHSTIRKLLNFDTQTIDYHQSALVTTTRLQRSHHNRAYERFLKDGVLAMLPLKNEENQPVLCASIWTASSARIADLLTLDPAAFLEELQTQFGYRLGRLQAISERHVFPLQFIQVKNPVQENVMLIGNAAHTIHPLAAQSLNSAFYEIAHLNQVLRDNLQNKKALSFGLREKAADFQPKVNLLFSHYLNQIFSSDWWGSHVARQLGMVGLDLCPPIKKQFSRLMAMENIQWLTT